MSNRIDPEAADRDEDGRPKADAPISTTGPTVTVGCKLLHGLILKLPITVDPSQRQIVLKGANQSNVIGGFGITRGVPQDFWETWIALNKGFKPLVLGLLFADSRESAAVGEAKDRKSLKHGQYRLNPDAPAPDLNIKRSREGAAEEDEAA